MFNISIKQTLLSYTARESHFAFYAADSGMECAEYWEYEGISNKFATTFVPTLPGNTDTIQCNGGNVTVTYTSNEGGLPLASPNFVRRFTLQLGPTIDSPCAEVVIIKTDTPATVLESRGYNTCDTNNPKRTERAIRITQ